MNCLSILRAKDLLIRAIVHTDVGCVRQNNEDSARFYFLNGSRHHFIAVLADGMGGYERGEDASALMVNTMCEDDSALMVNTACEDGCQEDGNRLVGKNPTKWLRGLMAKANNTIYEWSQQQEAVMGTTCSALLVWRKRVWCAHIGDSRIYMLLKGKLRQITCDHTVVGEMMRNGGCTAAQAAVHPQRSVLTKAIGTHPQIEPDIFKLKRRLRKGDRFLLCSDGLYDVVSDFEIAKLLSQKSIRNAAHDLVEAAKRNGGYDNITVLIVEINKKGGNEHDA